MRQKAPRLPELLRIYPALLRAGWARALEYRAQLALWLLSSVFPLVMMAAWLAVVAEAGPVTGWGEADFLSYYVASALVYQVTFSWIIWEWDEEIRTGNLSPRLLKPLDPLHHFLSEQIGIKILTLLVLAPLVILAAWITPQIQYPLTPLRLATFCLAVIAGFGMNVVMGSAFGMLSFWSTQSHNLFSLWWGAGSFLSGWIAPLALFPPVIRQVAQWLPFRSALSFPLEILTGQISGPQIVLGFGITTAWFLFFWIVYRMLWRRGLRRYEAVGA